MKWRIVGFNHPTQRNSVIYYQGLTDEQLIKAILRGIEKGCNLFSVRGFDEQNEPRRRVEQLKI